jgi:ssDNA-binding replication factor A large subunit
MNIEDISDSTENATIVGLIIEKRVEPTHHIELAKATLRDDTGKIILNLWRDQIDQCQIGDIVMITDAFAEVYNNILELNTGGSIIVLDRSSTN